MTIKTNGDGKCEICPYWEPKTRAKQPTVSIAYVLANYSKSYQEDRRVFTDPHAEKCVLAEGRDKLYYTRKGWKPWFAPTRKIARESKTFTEQIWKVAYNTKTGKITCWIKKNP
jgi:hypothetical protein